MDFFWHEMLEISLLLFIKHQLNTADISNHQATTHFSPPIPPQILDKDLFKYRHTLFSPLYKTLWNKGKELCTSCCKCCPQLWRPCLSKAVFAVQVLKDSCSWVVSSQSKSTTCWVYHSEGQKLSHKVSVQPLTSAVVSRLSSLHPPVCRFGVNGIKCKTKGSLEMGKLVIPSVYISFSPWLLELHFWSFFRHSEM